MDEGGFATMPVGFVLEPVGGDQQLRLGEGASDQLERRRQTVAGKTARYTYCWPAKIVDYCGIAGKSNDHVEIVGAALVRCFLDRRDRNRQDRREQQVDIGESTRGDCAQIGAAQLQRLDIFGPRGKKPAWILSPTSVV